ncbi:TetR/AcrR family transcriptional regulator [Pectobacterium jejuense]|uniref:TetR/AcrR family transcriptional regulator n=1 Tax=Pectobacterium jejuense TaxID=2974022 RepID=UPI0022808BB4|nr:TetR/AcrR family transcriptional regulator [Pectobacterium jejuense]MCY9846480.1 TetR/AcrR family transcriptional regulator [Pectobacterium jejuense]
MRYSKDHKEETRKRIVDAASKRFRTEGIEKVGVATLMADAKLTVGGFYSHFKSKEELIKEAVDLAADETFCAAFGDPKDGEDLSIEQILDRYLSPEHRDSPEFGCVIAALASELRNRPEDTRDLMSDKITRIIERISDSLSKEADSAIRMRVAGSIWAAMMGTLQLARIIPDKELSAQLLRDGKANALMLAEKMAIQEHR